MANITSKKIYLIRHGETDFNKLGIVQGRGVNSSLNDTGKNQARAFFEAYQHIPFKKIYISSLVRTYESVIDFINKGIPYEKLDGLDEISWGEKEGKSIFGEADKEYEEVIVSWQQGRSQLGMPGGESPEDVVIRQKAAIDYIVQFPEENPVLICMHGRAMRILLTWMSGLDMSMMDSFEHSNLCLYILNFSNNKLTIELANDKKHINLSR